MSKKQITTTVNGVQQEILVDSTWTLLETLRDQLRLTGTKEGCSNGNCGACTVVLDGRIVDSCCVLGAEIEGKTVETIEGMATPEGLHPLQQAWIAESVPQCGYCQAGQIMSAAALLASNPHPDDSQIRQAMSGNLCRCGTYGRIRRAIRRAAESGE